ncbi:polysaccharide pyruvyl transferase family protein [Aeromonas sp. S16(2024)]|uniref:polysaccharide pyruvyl transferase family protein n=1 Tax=Aeromonas sp. S16(2024) TaxID=3242889 RepID=UPI003526F10C
MKGIIIGWFGKNNLGDDLLEEIARDLILSNVMLKTLISVPISELHNNKNTENHISEADIVFIGPGGLINTGTNYIVEPLKNAKKIVLIGISIEDYTGSSDRVLQFLAEKSAISLFRDADSVNYFKRFSPVGVVSLISDLFLSANAEIFPNEVLYTYDNKIMALPRGWDKNILRNKYFHYLKNKMNNPTWMLPLTQSNEILSMCARSDEICVIDPADKDAFCYLSNKRGKKFIGCATSEAELRRWITNRNLISARYHGTLIALKYGVYTESYCYQNKLRNLCMTYDLPIYQNNTPQKISLSKLKDDGFNSMLEIKSKLSCL